MNKRIWRKLYEAALAEQDPQKLRERIDETETAIFLRLQTGEKSKVSEAELREIEQASATVLRLKIEELHFPELKVQR